MWWKKHKWKVLIPAMITAVLAFAFWYGGNAPGLRGWAPSSATPTPAVTAHTELGTEATLPTVQSTARPEAPVQTPEPTADSEAPAASIQPTASPVSSSAQSAPEPTQQIDPQTGKDQYQTQPVPKDKPVPVEPQETDVGSETRNCTISISCSTILGNMDLCDPEKRELVPEVGWLLEPITVTLYEGESVFNVLQRTCKQQKIHMEYEDTPMYNSAYIEGIGNLYEYDVGEQSGWMYQVNGWFPNYGCSRYQVKDGDVICWVYTCNLGKDVGDNSLSSDES